MSSSGQLLLCPLVSRSCPSVHSLDGRSSQSQDWQRASHSWSQMHHGLTSLQLVRKLAAVSGHRLVLAAEVQAELESGSDDPSPRHRWTENTCIGAVGEGGGGGSPIQLLAEKYRHIHRLGSAGKILG